MREDMFMNNIIGDLLDCDEWYQYFENNTYIRTQKASLDFFIKTNVSQALYDDLQDEINDYLTPCLYLACLYGMHIRAIIDKYTAHPDMLTPDKYIIDDNKKGKQGKEHA